MSRRQMEITPELMLRAYRIGLFPMAESREARTLYWLDPEQRGVIPLDGFHLSRRLPRRPWPCRHRWLRQRFPLLPSLKS